MELHLPIEGSGAQANLRSFPADEIFGILWPRTSSCRFCDVRLDAAYFRNNNEMNPFEQSKQKQSEKFLGVCDPPVWVKLVNKTFLKSTE